MKYIFSVASILLVVAGFYYFSSQAEAITERSVRYETATLLPLNSMVFIEDNEVSNETELNKTETIKTDTTGRALIKSGPQLLTSIGESSEVVFNSESDLKETSFDLLVGKLWSRLERALEQDEIYQVYTPTLAAAVRGTAFGAEVGEGIDRIVVTEGVVEVRDRNGDAVEMVAAGNMVSLKDGRLAVTPLRDNDYGEWENEHTNPEWEWGGSPDLTLVTATREGFWWSSAGLLTVEGTGFNQAVRLEIDDQPIAFVPVSDKVVKVPVSELINVREDSTAYIYLSNGERVSANEIFVGSEAEVRENLLW